MGCSVGQENETCEGGGGERVGDKNEKKRMRSQKWEKNEESHGGTLLILWNLPKLGSSKLLFFNALGSYLPLKEICCVTSLSGAL